jgi:hypothetical protein
MAKLKIIRIKNRSYRPGTYRDETTGESCDVQRITSHAEYAVVTGQTIHAKLKRNGSKWFAVAGCEGEKFGAVCSPMNVTSWRALRLWALKKWGG